MKRLMFGLVIAATTPVAAAAAPMGAVAGGWPVMSPLGDIHIGGDGGPVIAGPVDDFAASAAVARTPSAGLRWARTALFGCGNCPGYFDFSRDGGPYGHLGPSRAIWDDHGNVPTTAGPVGGRWISLGTGGTSTSTTVTATRGSSPSGWTVTLPAQSPNGYADSWDEPMPDAVKSTPSEILISIGPNFAAPFGSALPGTAGTRHIFALDPADGSTRWHATGARVLVGFTGGMIVRRDDTTTAIWNDDGTPRTVLHAGIDGSGAQYVPDIAHNRVYVTNRRTHRIEALDATSGQRVWITPTTEAVDLLDVASNGTVLARHSVQARRSLRAYSPAGSVLWGIRTLTPIVSARRLNDGTVAVAQVSLSGHFSGSVGTLARINPRGRQTVPTRVSVSLNRTAVGAMVDVGIGRLVAQDTGALLTIRSPTARTMSVRIVDSRFNRRVPWSALQVPAGRSFARISGDSAGTLTVQVRLGLTGPLVFQRQITVRP